MSTATRNEDHLELDTRRAIAGLKRSRPKTPAERIEALRRIVTNQQAELIDGSLVDLFSASAIVQVYDALNEVNKVKFSGLKVQRMSEITWKVVGK